MTPRREEWNERRVRPHRELRDHESRRGRNAKKIDEDRLIIKRVQVGQQAQRMFARSQELEHRTRCRQLVDRSVPKLLSDLIDELLDLRIVEPAHQKSARISEQRDSE